MNWYMFHLHNLHNFLLANGGKLKWMKCFFLLKAFLRLDTFNFPRKERYSKILSNKKMEHVMWKQYPAYVKS